MSSSKSQPKVKVEGDSITRLLDLVALICVGISIGYPAAYYSSLPDVIPIHFDFAGEADGFGAKQHLYWFGGINVFVFAGLYAVSRIPHMHNYMTTVTEENAPALYRNSVLMLKVLNVLICGFFCYLGIATVQIGLGMSGTLHSAAIFIFLGVLSVTTVVFIVRSLNIK